MPLSLTKAPAFFQSYINKCFAEKLDIFGIVYFDDILIFKNEERTKHKEVFK